ncbi:polysaccharide biosynthesis/export family protein [Synechococcus sp. PCC 6312]|uniref:SLBB domain-containing protein n=1 Tax=Synechococcus sp. (strain ATCC 27167 / PCC 6312) TaxID=195253 RepID=UPI00029F101F|nr:polysaccharide biosynthesis/export family protein [Synechococcus sp. PCC 6312]AFY59973.1 periplasmic protein involved in polysaccharide export [Synechococcus sp. PCC 6312]
MSYSHLKPPLTATLTQFFVLATVGLSVLAAEFRVLAQASSPAPNYRPNPGLAPATDSMNVYLLGPGDSIQVSVLGFDEYKGLPPQIILPDGTISIPLVERFVVSGKTVTQVKQELTRRLSEYLVDPTVEVQLTSLRPLTVTVAGEVRRPGPLQLQPIPLGESGSGGDETARSRIIPTLAQAIAAAGGVTKEADVRDIIINRIGVNGISQTMTVNLWNSIQASSSNQDISLRDGDSIFIPKATALSQGDQKLLARSAFGSPTVKVRVVGEVKRPGEIEVSPDSTLSSAIAVAGGPTDKANLTRVRFYRLQANGTVNEKTLNIEKLTEPTQVEDGDVIMIPKGDGYRFLDAIGTVLGPLGAAAAFIRIFQ